MYGREKLIYDERRDQKIRHINLLINEDMIIRFFDITLSFLFILLLSPFILFIMLLIKLNSPGPAVFKQTRVGLNGREFKCYKFRSMYHNVSQKHYEIFIEKALNNEYGNGIANNHVEFKRNDQRVTRIGKFLRTTSIDEIPQFFNVLKGDMSIVGPRPDVPLAVRKYSKEIKKRLSVLPGITGLWQVSGRSHLTLKQMYDLDVQFVEIKSLNLYFKILFKTGFIVLFQKGSG